MIKVCAWSSPAQLIEAHSRNLHCHISLGQSSCSDINITVTVLSSTSFSLCADAEVEVSNTDEALTEVRVNVSSIPNNIHGSSIAWLGNAVQEGTQGLVLR